MAVAVARFAGNNGKPIFDYSQEWLAIAFVWLQYIPKPICTIVIYITSSKVVEHCLTFEFIGFYNEKWMCECDFGHYDIPASGKLVTLAYMCLT